MDAANVVREFVKKELCTDSPVGPIQDDTQLIESGIVDSLGVMKLVSYIEKTFLIKIPAEDLVPENFETTGTIIKLVQSRTGGG